MSVVGHHDRAEEAAAPASIRTYKKQARRHIDARVLELVTDWIGSLTHTTDGAGRDVP